MHEPGPARPALREVVHYDRSASDIGEQARRYMVRTDPWQGSIAAVLEKAAIAGQLRPEITAALLARILFDIHLVEVRRWMGAGQLNPAQGQAMLRQAFAAVLGRRLAPSGCYRFVAEARHGGTTAPGWAIISFSLSMAGHLPAMPAGFHASGQRRST